MYRTINTSLYLLSVLRLTFKWYTFQILGYSEKVKNSFGHICIFTILFIDGIGIAFST